MWMALVLGLVPWAVPLLRRQRWAVWTVCLTAVAAVSVAAWWVVETSRPAAVSQYAYWTADTDVFLIMQGLEAAPTLRDTLGWWTGTWCGQVPFWRPLSSLLFWAEWKVFGRDFRLWCALSVVLVVALAAVALWALEPLIGVDGAGATVLAAFVWLAVPWVRIAPAFQLVPAWKDQTDLLAGLGILAGLGLAVRGRSLLWLLPVALAAAAKELGFVGFALVPAVLLWQRRWGPPGGSLGRAVAGAVVVAVALGLWHYAAVGVGYRMGTNAQWPRRALLYYGGLPTNALLNDGWHLVAITGLVGGAVGVARGGVWRSLAMLAMGVGAVLGLRALQTGQPFGQTAAVLVVDLPKLAVVLAWTVGAYFALRFSRPEVALGLLVMFLGAAPTFAATQTRELTRWLGGVGYSILAWATIRGAWEAAPLALRELKKGLGLPEGNQLPEPPPPTADPQP